MEDLHWDIETKNYELHVSSELDITYYEGDDRGDLINPIWGERAMENPVAKMQNKKNLHLHC